MFPPDGIRVYVGRTGPIDEDDTSFGTYVAAAISGFVSVGLFFGAWALVRGLYSALVGFLSNVPAAPIYGVGAGSAAVVLGGLLYLLRERKRAAYAYLELGAGFGTAVEAWIRLSSTPNTSTLVFSLFGSVYIIVRGFDNFAKARSEQRDAQAKARAANSAA